MRKLKSIPIILSFLIVFHFQSEAQLLDTISKNHYYEKEIFDDQYLDIYNSWMLKVISGGLSGEGYDADFDKMIMDSIGIFKTYRNDSLFIYGKITIVDQTDEQLLISFDADTVSGGIFFDDMYKYIDIRNDTLMLFAPCCDRYNYLFTSENQIVYIPDTAFLYALIDEGVDTNGDSLISYEEAEAVTSLRVIGKDISDMKGVEAFVNLQVLNCTNNEIKTLDLSNLALLSELGCASDQLTSLDITNNSALERLYCSGNEIADLDISNNTSLLYLNCSFNKLTSLDCSNNTVLEVLDCQRNMITSLKYNSLELETLWCSNNEISSLDISSNRALKSLFCGWNLLTSLDVSNNVELESLFCPCNYVTEIDISNNSALISLDVGNYTFASGNNQISSLDVSDNPMLRDLNCNYNQLTNLDVTNNTALTGLDCSGNQLITLDISKNRALGTGIYGINRLILSNMPSLYEVCVGTDPFPPAYLEIDTTGSPNVYFQKDCNGDGTVVLPSLNSLPDIKEIFFRERPQSGDNLIRKQVFCSLDELIEDPSHNERKFFDIMFTKALYEIQNEEVTEGVSIWQIYNHGFVVKTPSLVFGFDLSSPIVKYARFNALANLLDAIFISHKHGDHYSRDLILRMHDLHKPVVMPSEATLPYCIGMDAGEKKQIAGLNVTAHDGLHSIPLRQFEIITPEGIRILHTGDNQTSETIPEIKDVNILLLNAWVNESGWSSNITGINNSLIKIKPDVCLLGHFQELGHDVPLKYCPVANSYPPLDANVLAWGERYHYDDISNDTISPKMVEDIKYQFSQDSISLTWELPETSEDGENATFYRVVKDNLEDVFLIGLHYVTSWDSISSYNFKVYSYDHCGNQSDQYAEIDVEFTGLSYNPLSSLSSSLMIYPNPTTGDILNIKTEQAGYHSIEITSLKGQLLYSTKIEGPTHQIDLSSFEKGLYFITIRCRDYVRTEKIIKQ